MKRNTIGEVIFKAVMLDCDAVLYAIKYGSVYSRSSMRILNAAVNEITRINDKLKNHYLSEGYEAGFTCAEIASISDIKASDIQPGPSTDLALTTPGAGLSPLQEEICRGLKPLYDGSEYWKKCYLKELSRRMAIETEHLECSKYDPDI